MIDARSGQYIYLKIDAFWIQIFVNRLCTVSHAQKDKKMSPQKEIKIGISVAYHLRTLSNVLRVQTIYDNNIENAAERHFVFKVHIGRTLGSSEDQVVKCADAAGVGEGLKMLVRVTSGRDFCIEQTFVLLQN